MAGLFLIQRWRGEVPVDVLAMLVTVGRVGCAHSARGSARG